MSTIGNLTLLRIISSENNAYTRANNLEQRALISDFYVENATLIHSPITIKFGGRYTIDDHATPIDNHDDVNLEIKNCE